VREAERRYQITAELLLLVKMHVEDVVDSSSISIKPFCVCSPHVSQGGFELERAGSSSSSSRSIFSLSLSAQFKDFPPLRLRADGDLKLRLEWLFGKEGTLMARN